MSNTLYDHPEDYDNEYIDFYRDIAFWEWNADQYAGDKPIVEFACGTGRVTLPLARKYSIIGVDLSDQMLRIAHNKVSLSNQDLNVQLYLGDMCDFKTGLSHNLVIVPFTSFANVIGTENQQKALHNFHTHLVKGGHLVIDIFNPSILHLANGVNQFPTPTFEKRIRLNDGGLLVRYQTTRYYQSIQQTQWVFYIEIYDAHTNEMTRKYTEEATVQVIFPNEWRMLLKLAGFEIINEFGDYDRKSFNDSSPRMLFVCKKV